MAVAILTAGKIRPQTAGGYVQPPADAEGGEIVVFDRKAIDAYMKSDEGKKVVSKFQKSIKEQQKQSEKIAHEFNFSTVDEYLDFLAKLDGNATIDDMFEALVKHKLQTKKTKKKISVGRQKKGITLTNTFERKDPYVKMYQNKGLNALATVSKNLFALNKHKKTAQAIKDKVTIKVDNFNFACLKTQTTKTMDILAVKLAENLPYGEDISAENIDKHREVALSLDEYMSFLKINDKKEARRKLNESIKSLYDATLEYDETRWEKEKCGKITTRWKARVLDAIGEDYEEKPVQNGTARVKFTFDVAKCLGKSYLTEFPTALFSINTKYNPHSYNLGRKLVLHHNMNIAKDNANRIGVKSLIEACPDLPTYDEVMKDARQITKRIIEPFERDLEALVACGILTEWHYCNSKDTPLTDEQLANYSYGEWIKWLVEFELANYPDQTERIAKIEARQEKAKKRKAKQEK